MEGLALREIPMGAAEDLVAGLLDGGIGVVEASCESDPPQEKDDCG